MSVSHLNNIKIHKKNDRYKAFDNYIIAAAERHLSGISPDEVPREIEKIKEILRHKFSIKK